MSQYQPPVLDAKFVLDQLIGFDGLCEKLQLEDINICLLYTSPSPRDS